MVHYGWEEVIQAITSIPEAHYDEVIQSLPQPPPRQDQQTPQPEPGALTPAEPGQEPSALSFQAGKQGCVPRDPSKHFLRKVDVESMKAGFPDMWETQRVKEYLILNGNYRLIPVSTASMHWGLSIYINSVLWCIDAIM